MFLSSINNTYTHLTCPVIKTIVCANICNKIFYHSYNLNDGIYNIHIYTTSEKPVNDQNHGVLDRCGIAILYK